MSRENKNARRAFHNNGERKVSTQDTNQKYTTPLAIAAGALLAFPIVDDLTNMPSLSYFGLAVFAVAVSIISVSLSESMRCSR